MEVEAVTFRIERLDAVHDRQTFDCGVDSLTNYLRRSARQDMDRGATIVHVLVASDEPTKIAGYYTLSNASVLLQDLPEEMAKKLPRYPDVPATLLGRLAVATKLRGQHLGELLLTDALFRSLNASKEVASVAVIVDALDERAAQFYERYGFIRFPERVNRLFLPMKDIDAALR